ncbi:LPS translocon maturation chaperone LptM [Geminicoccus sp.]|jgi:predicted small lipoprotein YifL
MRKLLVLAILLLPLALSACGKKGTLEVPPEPANESGNP